MSVNPSVESQRNSWTPFPWTFTVDSVDSLDFVQEHSGKSPVSPWTQSSESQESVDSLDFVQGHWKKSRMSRQTGQCPGSPWTKSSQWILSMD